MRSPHKKPSPVKLFDTVKVTSLEDLMRQILDDKVCICDHEHSAICILLLGSSTVGLG